MDAPSSPAFGRPGVAAERRLARQWWPAPDVVAAPPGDERMAVEQLVMTLMLEAAVLDALAFQLTRLRLLVLAGGGRFLARASVELEELTGELKVLEVLRAMAADELASWHGLSADATLSELTAAVGDEPNRAALEHCRQRVADASAEAAERRDRSLQAITKVVGGRLSGGQASHYRLRGQAGHRRQGGQGGHHR